MADGQIIQDTSNVQSVQAPPFFPNYIENRVGLAKELDPQKALVETIWILRGQIKNADTGRVETTFKRMMNEDGVAIFITAVKAGANSINTYSNYRTDDKLIYRILSKWINDLVYTFYYERKRFIEQVHPNGVVEICLIEDESNVSHLINLACGLLLPSFLKALGAGDRGAITRTIQETINRALRDAEEMGRGDRKRGGFLSMLNPFKKNG